jgi:hypothetical protein
VADDHAGTGALGGELVEGHEVDPAPGPAIDLRAAVLHQHGLVDPQRGGGRDEAVEGLLVGPRGDDDHAPAKRLPANAGER